MKDIGLQYGYLSLYSSKLTFQLPLTLIKVSFLTIPNDCSSLKGLVNYLLMILI